MTKGEWIMTSIYYSPVYWARSLAPNIFVQTPTSSSRCFSSYLQYTINNADKECFRRIAWKKEESLRSRESVHHPTLLAKKRRNYIYATVT